jgi:hypothetical protein
MQNVEHAKRRSKINHFSEFRCCSLASLDQARRRPPILVATRTPVEQALLAIDRLAD